MPATTHSRMQQSYTTLAKGNIAQAQATFDNAMETANKKYNKYYQPEHSASLFAVATDVAQHHYNWFKLPNIQLETLAEIAQSGSTDAEYAVIAHNILRMNEAENYEYTPLLPQPNNERRAQIAYEIAKPYISVQPNPANAYIIVKYDTKQIVSENCDLIIYDLNGIEKIRKPITNTIAEIVIDTKTLPTGMYYIKLCNSSSVAVQKFNISKQ